MARDVLLLANARVVLAERVIEAGWVAAENGRIVEIAKGRAPDHAEDLAGDLLLPGLVDCIPIISRRTTCLGPRCTGIRSRPSFPTTDSLRPAALPPRSIRCAYGEGGGRGTRTARPGHW